MTRRGLSRERAVWGVAVALLASAVCWLATVDAFLVLTSTDAGAGIAAIASRAMRGAAWTVFAANWLSIAGGIAAGAALLLATRASRRRAGGAPRV